MSISWTQLVGVFITVILIGAFSWFFKRSTIGVSMRAVSDDQLASMSVGISVPKVFGLAWAMAGLSAAAAGGIIGNITGLNFETLRAFGITVFPVVILGISSRLDPVEMTQLIEDQIRYRFARIPGVAQVDLWGGYNREVRIELDPERIKAAGLPLDQVIDAIEDANLDLPTGKIEQGRYEVTLRAPAGIVLDKAKLGRGDISKDSEKRLELSVGFTAKTRGEQAVEANASYALAHIWYSMLLLVILSSLIF